MYFLKSQKQLFKNEQRDIVACVNDSILSLHHVLYQEPFYIRNLLKKNTTLKSSLLTLYICEWMKFLKK